MFDGVKVRDIGKVTDPVTIPDTLLEQSAVGELNGTGERQLRHGSFFQYRD